MSTYQSESQGGDSEFYVGGPDDDTTVIAEMNEGDYTTIRHPAVVPVEAPAAHRERRGRRLAGFLGALVIGLGVGTVGGYLAADNHILHDEPAPTAMKGVRPLSVSQVNGLAEQTAEACDSPRDVLPEGKHVIKDGVVRITDGTDRVVIVSENRGLYVSAGVKVGQAFFCAKGPDVVNDGEIGTLGVNSYDADVTLNGITRNVFVNNRKPEDGSTGSNSVRVHGGVGNLAYQGDGLSIFKPVKVTGPTGHVVHAYQDAGSKFMIFNAFDRQAGGVVDDIAEFQS